MEETWKDIQGYEGIYKVSNLGRIKSLPRFVYNYKSFNLKGYYSKEKIIKQFKNYKGYLVTQLSNNGKSKTFIVHRLVAKAFIPNPDNKPQVNHINCNKEDNRVKNLEWCTNNENKAHAKIHGLCKASKGKENSRAKKVKQYSLNGELIKKWDCINDIAREFNLKTASNISLCCKHKSLSAYGYKWEYAED